MFLNEIISLFEKIYKEWKINKEHVNCQHQEFLKIASKAIRQTLSYISPNRKERDKRIEEQLSELWAQVAVAVQPLDPDLASRCYLKSNYWADPDRLSDEEIKKARIEIKRVEKEIEGYFKGRTIVKNKKTTEKKVKLSNAKPSYKKIWAIIVSLIIISAAFTTFIVNIDKIKEIYFSQKLQSPKTTGHNLPKSEAKTRDDSYPAITSGPNVLLTSGYSGLQATGSSVPLTSVYDSPLPVISDLPVSKTEQSIEIIPNTSEKDIDNILTKIRNSKKLRKLMPLETGRNISETPAGTYFFISPVYVAFSDGDINSLLKICPVNMYRVHSYYIEIHKRSESQIILLGYVGNETAALLSNESKQGGKNIVVFPSIQKDFQNLIMIPINRITKSKHREISTPEIGNVSVLDMVIE